MVFFITFPPFLLHLVKRDSDEIVKAAINFLGRKKTEVQGMFLLNHFILKRFLMKENFG